MEKRGGTALFRTDPFFPLKTPATPHPQDPSRIQAVFSKIATRYDLANHILSMGLDFGWRSQVARRVARHRPLLILDLATGSGDLALTLARFCPSTRIIAGDFCLPMLHQAQQKAVPHLVGADGLHLPFAPETFDTLTVAFGLRNMANYSAALAGFQRVLKPGGQLIVLDFSMPGPLLAPFYRFYLRTMLPPIASVLTGDREAYDYLGESIEAFPRGTAMLQLMSQTGFQQSTASPLAGGIVSLYEGFKGK